MEKEIKFKDLSVSLKVAIVVSWIIGGYLGFWMIVGFLEGFFGAI